MAVRTPLLAALGLMAALAACSGPPVAAPGQILGYGTPGVETYLPAGEGATLASLRVRCRAVPVSAAPPRPQTLEAACDQFRRTLRNQPGSTLARDS